MDAKLITAAAANLVSLAEARTWCGISAGETGWDGLLADLIAMATEEVEQITGRALGQQTWEVYADAFADELLLEKGPVISVTSVKYTDLNGAEQTASVSLYATDTIGLPARIVLLDGESWPEAKAVPNAVRIRFVTGHVAEDKEVRAIKAAIAMAVAARWENRTAEFPKAAAAMLEPYRTLWVAA